MWERIRHFRTRSIMKGITEDFIKITTKMACANKIIAKERQTQKKEEKKRGWHGRVNKGGGILKEMLHGRLVSELLLAQQRLQVDLERQQLRLLRQPREHQRRLEGGKGRKKKKGEKKNRTKQVENFFGVTPSKSFLHGAERCFALLGSLDPSSAHWHRLAVFTLLGTWHRSWRVRRSA